MPVEVDPERLGASGSALDGVATRFGAALTAFRPSWPASAVPGGPTTSAH